MNKHRKTPSLETQEKARILDLAHILILDMDSRITLWNTGAEKLYGWTKGEAIGLISHELLKTVFPELLEVIMAKLLTDNHWQGELIHTNRDGKHILVTSHWELFCNEHGNPVAILEVNNDITLQKQAEGALREAEIKFRALVEQIPNTIIYTAALDERSTTLYISPQIFQILAYTQEEFKEDPDIWAKTIYPDDRARVMAELEHSHKTGDLFVSEYRMIRKDGQTIWFSDEAHIVKDEHGNPLFLLGVNTDITERKQAEGSLREREKELEDRTHNLQEVNIALKILLKNREEDKAALEERVLINVKQLLMPFIEKLKKAGLDGKSRAFVDILESNMNEIISPFAHTLTSFHINLTPTEIKIANLIKQGKTSKEICELLGSSFDVVLFHRSNIRKKLGLLGKKTNLKSYLIATA